MPRRQLIRSARVTTAAVAAVLAVGLTPGLARATASTPTSAHTTAATTYRQLIGTVSSSTYLEASVPKNGSYAIEYDIITGTAFFDTYLNGTELGYVAGSKGTYFTKTLYLPAGGQLVRVVGPEGVGTARVYIISR